MLLLENRPAFFSDLAGAQPAGRVGGAGQPGSARGRTHLYGRPFRAGADRGDPGAAGRIVAAASDAAGLDAGDRAGCSAARPPYRRRGCRRRRIGRSDARRRSSIPRGRQVSRRAAFCPTSTSCTPATGMPIWAGIALLTEDGERMITPLPVFHMNAMAASFMGMVSVGGCLTVLDRFHPRTWWADVRLPAPPACIIWA
jgi:hypothetical protein